MKLLNVGCGARCHPAWVNLDLSAQAPGVIEHDLRKGLPFDEGAFDAVYHSHVLEHLTPEDGRATVQECFRVLRPGGVLRVVVPDLEGIVREYLRTLDEAPQENDKENNVAKQTWMRLELLDQMTRVCSGGQAAAFIRRASSSLAEYLSSRWGEEFVGLAGEISSRQHSLRRRKLAARVTKEIRRFREKLATTAVFLLMGQRGRLAWEEGFFRQSGEVHRWMYDRFSLGELLGEVGFEKVRVVGAEESAIAGFADYELDTTSGRVRKPDSLFMEGVKRDWGILPQPAAAGSPSHVTAVQDAA